MVTTSELEAKCSEILNEAQKIGIKNIFISEQQGFEDSAENEYISPFSFIIETEESNDIDQSQLLLFTDFLKSGLSNVGIKVYFKYLLEEDVLNDGFLAEGSKHFLDSAIDITQISTEKSWKIQFEEQRNKKRDSQVDLQTEPREIETCLKENKRQKLDHPSAEISLPNALQVDTSAEFSAEEAKQMKEQNIKLTWAIQRLLEDKKVIIPQNVRRQLQEEFPQIFTSQQSVK